MMIATLLAVAAVHAQAPEDDDADFRGLLDQAQFFLKKSWFDDAKDKLEAAVATEDGRIDPEAWYLLARVRYETGDLVGARSAAERAHSYSRDDNQLEQAASFAEYLRDSFGIVEIQASFSGLGARLDITLESILFDPDQKAWLERLQTRMANAKVPLPHQLGLPAGSYDINGAKVTVENGGQTAVLLEASQLRTGGPLAVKLAQLEIAFGGSAWFGADANNLLPTGHLQAALSQPIGPLVLGVMLDWSPRAYRTHDGRVTGSLNSWSLGARVGFEWSPIGGLIVRPSAGYRYGLVPGIEVDCTTVAPGDFLCGTDAPREMVVYATGRAHIPLVELYVGFLDRSRTSSVGVGVKTVVEEAMGALPRQATAGILGQQTDITFTIPDGARAWNATGVRILANLDLAF